MTTEGEWRRFGKTKKPLPDPSERGQESAETVRILIEENPGEMNLANVIERSIEVVEITISNVERQWRWVFGPVVIILATDEMARTKKRTSSDGIEQLTENH